MEQVGMRESAYCGRSGGRAAARGPGAPPKGGTQALPAADFRPRLAVVLAAPKRCSPGALLPWEPAALGSCCPGVLLPWSPGVLPPWAPALLPACSWRTEPRLGRCEAPFNLASPRSFTPIPACSPPHTLELYAQEHSFRFSKAPAWTQYPRLLCIHCPPPAPQLHVEVLLVL